MNYFITIKFLIWVMLLSNMLPSAVCNGHSVTDLWLPSACLVTRVESVPAFRKNSGVLQYLEIRRVLIPVWIGFMPKYMNQIHAMQDFTRFGIRHKTAASRMAGILKDRHEFITFYTSGQLRSVLSSFITFYMFGQLRSVLSSFSSFAFHLSSVSVWAMSKTDILAAVPKSRCPPSPTPPPSWITPVSRQSRPTVLEFTGQCGQYWIEGSNIQETRDLLQTVLHTESQHVQHVQHMQFQQMLTLSQNMMFSNALGIQPSSFRAPIVDRDERMDGSNVVSEWIEYVPLFYSWFTKRWNGPGASDFWIRSTVSSTHHCHILLWLYYFRTTWEITLVVPISVHGPHSWRTLSRSLPYQECIWNWCTHFGSWQMDAIFDRFSATILFSNSWLNCAVKTTTYDWPYADPQRWVFRQVWKFLFNHPFRTRSIDLYSLSTFWSLGFCGVHRLTLWSPASVSCGHCRSLGTSRFYTRTRNFCCRIPMFRTQHKSTICCRQFLHVCSVCLNQDNHMWPTFSAVLLENMLVHTILTVYMDVTNAGVFVLIWVRLAI